MTLSTYEEAIDFLQQNDISYHEVKHEAVWTMAEANKLDLPNDVVIKNLFLKKRKTNEFFLCIVVGQKKVDFKTLAPQLQLSRSKLGFANEMDLADVLGLKPGFVTPLGLPHDVQNQVTVLLDKELQKVDSIGIHPNSNTATVFVTYENLLKIIKCSHHQMMIVDLD